MSDIIDIIVNSPGGAAFTGALSTKLVDLFWDYLGGGKKGDEKNSASNTKALIVRFPTP
jgi:hypothetical protein